MEQLSVACLVVNGAAGRIDNSELIERLFQGQAHLDPNRNESVSSVDRAEAEYYRWHVKNKYYQADVPVIVGGPHLGVDVQDGTAVCPETFRVKGGNDELVRVSHGAVVYYGDEVAFETMKGPDEKPAGLERAFSCSCDQPDQVRLLVMESSPSEDVKERLLIWAFDNGTELIDLTPSSPDASEDCSQSDSISRVTEALQAYIWPSSSSNSSKPGGVNQRSSAADKTSDDSKGPEPGGGAAMGFEALMSKLSLFKRTADNIGDNERKAFAEQIAMEFYRCIGDDDSEEESDPQGVAKQLTEDDGGSSLL